MSMNKLVAAAAAIVAVGTSTSAFAETLTYDFTMTVTSVVDAVEPGSDTSVFNGFTTGETMGVSVVLNSDTNTATINVSGLDVEAQGGSSYSWVSTWTQSNDKIWQAGTGLDSTLLTFNGSDIASGSVHQNLWLDFSKTSSGDLVLSSGTMTINVDNTIHAKLSAEFKDTPVATPELDPTSGMGAVVLVLGGATIAFSRRRRFITAQV